MAKRQSVNGSRARHENPIPNASRIGNIVMSSVIGGSNPGTRELPATLEQQVANVFGYIRHDIEAAARPARHTQPLPADSRALVQADFVAVLS
jgi:2-iminobutanoate/2-iminopropanoate deaminase